MDRHHGQWELQSLGQLCATTWSSGPLPPSPGLLLRGERAQQGLQGEEGPRESQRGVLLNLPSPASLEDSSGKTRLKKPFLGSEVRCSQNSPCVEVGWAPRGAAGQRVEGSWGALSCPEGWVPLPCLGPGGDPRLPHVEED